MADSPAARSRSREQSSAILLGRGAAGYNVGADGKLVGGKVLLEQVVGLGIAALVAIALKKFVDSDDDD